jgi:hypothetical protein
MAGFKTFVDGPPPIYAAEVNGYLMRQTVMRFATTVALENALPVGVRELGMLAWADNVQILYLFNGTNWIPLESPEKTFTPVFTAGGSSITYGNAVVVSRWRYSGGMVKWQCRIQVGSTSNLGVGAYAWTLPIAVRADYDQHWVGALSYLDASAGTTFHRACSTLGTTTSFGAVAEAGQRMGAAAPVAWAQNDVFGIDLCYPPATSAFL